MTTRCSLFAIGDDRPGIVATVTAVFADVGCNIEDSRMTVLHGQFAIMLVVELPDDIDVDELEAAIYDASRDLDLLVNTRALPERQTLVDLGEVVTISVHGADHPGIVARVATTLATLGVNIVDLQTQIVDEAVSLGYVMVLSVTLPATLDEPALARALATVARELNVECVVRPGNTDLL